ncbi:hypothetical protein IQ268_08725 [Oculatella sp. LEGE 06141]|uniref:hypothetical protein n=1 Tax=Oculatella sp. LEGE 06141 TaxID=1828648 RepID=UPI001881EBAF|nr:hypothetical protein [Oculatella sp. LEGE 06141]MBE9178642.1 hypothetical protein [Oculatella sp. LEGE 06141]
MTTQPSGQPNSQNPTLMELRSLRREFAELKSEVTGLRADLNNKKPLDITDQVAKGVVVAGFFWIVMAAFFQACMSL